LDAIVGKGMEIEVDDRRACACVEESTTITR
jgi:hypothetical protein